MLLRLRLSHAESLDFKHEDGVLQYRRGGVYC
jgi:hypothetical protein